MFYTNFGIQQKKPKSIYYKKHSHENLLTKKFFQYNIYTNSTAGLSQETEETPDTGRYVQVQVECQPLPGRRVGRKDK